ncbi:hypothetical protein GCM10010269_77110 [Streptomyces humidus]|uniref:Zinc-binding dehydrogenase n=1 Tax=Streptomyces humidus TaxID=52259 RepID=A0A918GBG6_9ACTN|nr:hypothetical protein GCM10010269_77110 [Streptomyces humidus]
MVGSVTGAVVENLSLPPVFMRAVTMRGVPVGSRELFEDMARAVGRHRVTPVADRVFSGLASVGDALTTLANGSHFGKLVTELPE